MLKPAAIDLADIVQNEVEQQKEKPSSPEDTKPVLREKNSRKKLETQKAVIKKLLIASIICLIFMVVEIVGGLIAGSIAVLSDAAHMLSDVVGLIVSVLFAWLSTRPASGNYSFGFHRAGVIGALASVILLWIFTGILVYFAGKRIAHEEKVEGKIMFITAVFGLIVNIIMIKILHGGHDHHGHGHSHSHGASADDHAHDHKHEHKEGEKCDHNTEAAHMPMENVLDNDDHKVEKKNSVEELDIEKHSHHHENGDSHSHHEEKHDHKKEKHSHTHKHDHAGHHHDHKKGHSHDHGSHGHSHGHGHGHGHNENLRAAMLHVLGDALQSVGVVIASILIWIWPEKLRIADPICTFIFSVLVLFSSIPIVKDCIRVLMEGTPKGMNIRALLSDLEQIPGVKEVHDLHVWCISADKVSMSVHIRTSSSSKQTLKEATSLSRKAGIQHTTIQVEEYDEEEDGAFHDCSHHDIH